MILNKIRALFTVFHMAVSIATVIILMYIFKKSDRAIRHKWSILQMKLLGIKLEIKGTIDHDADMLLLNHQSVLDIIVFEYLHKKNLAWVAKKEIADIPFYGHILKAPDMIVVERESKTSLIQLLKDVRSRIKNGRPIAIFPEGTRTDGKKIRKFKSGAKIIAEKFKMNVQPAVIIGTKEILDSQNLSQKPGVVKIVYLPTVKADKKTQWYEKLEDDMKTTLANELHHGV